jgi:tetratricopeptide (TPR) repeat protein
MVAAGSIFSSGMKSTNREKSSNERESPVMDFQTRQPAGSRAAQLFVRPLALLVGALFFGGCRSMPSHSGDTNGEDAGVTKKVEAHAHYAAGVIHEMNDEGEAALQEYYQAALNDPENETLIVEVSRRFAQKKQPEKALEVLTRAAKRPKASGTIYAHLGFVYSQMGKQEQAVAANREAIRRAPTSFSGYQNLYLNYLQNKQQAEAYKVLEEAAKQPHVDVEFLINLSELYANYSIQVPARKQEATAQALALLNRAEKLKPRGPGLRMKLADGFNLLGDSAKAAQLYLDLLTRLPDLPAVRDRVRARLTEIYLRGSDHKGAIEQLEAIVRDDPTNAQACYMLASVFYEEKKLPEAADYFEKTLLLNPNFEQAYYDLASVQIGLDKTTEALSTLGRARQKFSQSFVLELLTGMAFSRQKAFKEAIQHYTAAEVIAQATEPKRLNHIFYFQLGAAHERQGDREEAEKYFERCLQLSPDFAEGLNYLGYIERGVNLPRARELIEKALKLEPKNAAYLDSLGWVLFKLDQPEEALGHILKATELAEEPDATLYDHLGDIYAVLKQPEKAQAAWRKSLAIESNDEVKKKVEAGEKK